MAYFDYHPNLLLPSFSPNRNSSKDGVVTKNLFRRGKIRDEYFENAMSFQKYNIRGDDRPDNVAQEIYDDSSLDWVILISNNIINVRDEWPMSQYDFQRLLDAGQQVNADFTFNYSQGGSNYSLSGDEILTSYTNYDYEVKVNEEKRNIFVLRKEYLEMIMNDLRQIMTYTNSSQYVSKTMKMGANIRNS